MDNLFFQGKLIRQFWGKINRQSTRHFYETSGLQFVTRGGGIIVMIV